MVCGHYPPYITSGCLLELTRNYGDSIGSFRRAFKELRGQVPELDFYVHQTWNIDRVLPWNHIIGPLPQPTLIKHLESATAQMVSIV
jgi:hypothetical protein